MYVVYNEWEFTVGMPFVEDRKAQIFAKESARLDEEVGRVSSNLVRLAIEGEDDSRL